MSGQKWTLWVGEAVMTKAGQIGKPHPAGTGEEGQGS